MGFHPIVQEQLERGQGLVAAWQLVEAGCTPEQIRHAARQLREVHRGVWLSGHAPVTDWQRRKSATLTAPGTYLAEWSAGAFFGFRSGDRWPTTVKRTGDGGPRTFGARSRSIGSLRVFYSDDVVADATVVDGIDVICAGRTLLDLIGRVSERTGRRYMRDALRLKVVDPLALQVQMARHPGRRAIEPFRRFAAEYGPLGMHRGKSDAETLALALLAAEGVHPKVNTLVAGEEADLVRPDLGLIVELDGPQYHLFITEDARKQAAWERAGWVVRRLPTDDVYDLPHLLLAAATNVASDEERAIAAATQTAADVIPRLEAQRAAREAAASSSNVRKLGL